MPYLFNMPMGLSRIFGRCVAYIDIAAWGHVHDFDNSRNPGRRHAPKAPGGADARRKTKECWTRKCAPPFVD